MSVVFSQFKARLKDHWSQVKALVNWSEMEASASARDWQLYYYPWQMHNDCSKPFFDLTDAKLLLREDVKANRHVTMKSSEFQRTCTVHGLQYNV
jgi:hypothetical protein